MPMSRLLVLTAVFLTLAVPAALAAPPADKGKNKTPAPSSAAPGQSEEKNAAKKCKAEREQLGAQAFMDKYGTNANKKNAFGKCVSSQSKSEADEAVQEAKENAAKKCKAERAQIGLEAFRAKYGTNANKKNAFGKCVAQLAKKATSS
jgi:hypothetical protein